MNAAIDRTLTVPSFQVGHRHRASLGLTLAGGKGINVARALKLFDVPVVATGLAGGRTGTRIVEELTSEAILNDFVRIADESRTSTAVVDPTAATYTEINEWGPQVAPEELVMLLDKISYLDRSADMGARNVLVTTESRSFGLFRPERKRLLFRADAPRVDPISAVGSGDVLLASFLAARLAERPLDESLRSAVAAGAASTLEVAAGRFEPREATRLQGSVDVRELEPVAG